MKTLMDYERTVVNAEQSLKSARDAYDNELAMLLSIKGKSRSGLIPHKTYQQYKQHTKDLRLACQLKCVYAKRALKQAKHELTNYRADEYTKLVDYTKKHLSGIIESSVSLMEDDFKETFITKFNELTYLDQQTLFRDALMSSSLNSK